ncbi:MAG: hypothetical protein JRD89_05010 [Deltaproteobacteria bacterium]|nr:hypothetical protein [Deltaproteobacteria bacterium]
MVQVTRILPPDEWRKRQLSTLKAIGEANYRQGIARPKKDPIEAGIAAEDKWAARIREAIEERRRAKALSATNMAEWGSFAEQIGAGRLVEGVTKREVKVDRFVKGFQPMLLDHVSKIDAMPAVTDADMEQRMLENLRGLKALKGAWR